MLSKPICSFAMVQISSKECKRIVMKPSSTIVRTLLGRDVQVVTAESVSGGCISNAWRVALDDGSVQFMKCNKEEFAENFQCEQNGLEALAEASRDNADLGIPTPVSVGTQDGNAWLMLPWIEQASTSGRFFERFGRGLAQLHRATCKSEMTDGQVHFGRDPSIGSGGVGWSQDNWLGSARQINRPASSWAEFFAEQRIGFQLKWAVDQGRCDDGLRRNCEAICDSMSDLLDGREHQTSVLHGDLWSGNYLAGEDAIPILIDPAVYRGCREAEFGMIRLFGGCPESFDDAYSDAFPLPVGCERRIRVYVLYHLLNHLNLFGSGYLSQCRCVAAEILGC